MSIWSTSRLKFIFLAWNLGVSTKGQGKRCGRVTCTLRRQPQSYLLPRTTDSRLNKDKAHGTMNNSNTEFIYSPNSSQIRFLCANGCVETHSGLFVCFFLPPEAGVHRNVAACPHFVRTVSSASHLKLIPSLSLFTPSTD